MSSTSLPVPFTLALYFIILAFPSAIACPENDYVIPDVQVGRFFFLRNDAPITKELAKHQPVVDATEKILNHMARIEDLIYVSIGNGSAPRPNDDIRPCNFKLPSFGKKSRMFLGIRSWPAPNFTCTTDVFGTDLNQGNVPNPSPPQMDVDNLFDALYNRGKVIKDNVESITKKVINNFTNPDIRWNYHYETVSQRCVLHPALGYRIEDKWYIADIISNRAHRPDPSTLGSQRISEYSRVVNGKLGNPKLMCLPIRPKTGVVHETRADATTLIASTRVHRAPNPSFVGQLPIDENPAILRSLDESDLFVQQAEDALVPSNIAILVLPIVLNLIPIALLSDVSTLTMLLYTLMSDILTVIPLGIKGAELVIIGLRRHRTIFVRIAGSSNRTRFDGTVAEMYGAECRVHENVLPAGIAFLVLSIVFLVGGVAAEFIARSCTMERRKRQLEELEEASSEMSWKESWNSTGFFSHGMSQPSTFSSGDIVWGGVVGNSFPSIAFGDSYDGMKTDKKE